MNSPLPSKDMSKPERNNYPPGYFGDREYSEALTIWHREQFGHAQTCGPADGLCGIKGCTKPWRHPGDCAHGGESTHEPIPVVHGVVYDRGGWICSMCHGWNCLKQKHCQHAHSGSTATKEVKP
jgi:hypothetical protein